MIDVNEYFRENTKKHAAVAWKGYQSKGKGAVVAKIHFPDNDASKAVIGESLEYLSENELLINGFSGAPVDEVRICDPETEIVVLVTWPDGGLSIERTGPIPEHFFQPSDQ
jgi:hypothetical protein